MVLTGSPSAVGISDVEHFVNPLACEKSDMSLPGPGKGALKSEVFFEICNVASIFFSSMHLLKIAELVSLGNECKKNMQVLGLFLSAK